MSALQLSEITKFYNQGGVDGVSFTAAPGTITAIVGPSGSGKSTILKMIAGFIHPQRGSIMIGDEIVASSKKHVEPQDRHVGLVFQNHALLPHMTVRKNVEFGVRNKKAKPQSPLETIMRDLKIDHLVDRYPHQISGGESQRVSLARALASNPSIFLMDEPFSSLDSVLRRDLRNEISRLLRARNKTAIIVTHDAEEAMEMADQIVVLDGGKVLQVGTPREVYYHPKTPKVAELFGEVNYLEDPELILALTGTRKDKIYLRPEALSIGDKGVKGDVVHIAYRGNYNMISVIIQGQRCLKIKTFEDNTKVGEKVFLNGVI